MLDEETKNRPWFLIVIIALLCLASYWYGSSSTISNLRERDATIIEGLSEIKRNQQSFTTQYDRNTKALTDLIRRNLILEETVNRIEGNTTSALGRERENEELINEAREIDRRREQLLQTVLERSKERDKQVKN